MKNLVCLFLALLLCVLTLPVYASEETFSIEIGYSDEDQPIENAVFSLYHTADIHGNLTEPYSDSGIMVGAQMKNDEMLLAARLFKQYAAENSIEADAVGTTGHDGMVTFRGLVPGIYTVSGAKITNGVRTYISETFLVWLYDNVECRPKYIVDERPVLDSYAYSGGYDPEMGHRTKVIYESLNTSITDEVYLDGLIVGDTYRLRSVIINDSYDDGYPTPALFDGKTMQEHHESGLAERAEDFMLKVFEDWGIPFTERGASGSGPANSLRTTQLYGLTLLSSGPEIIEDNPDKYYPPGMWFGLPADIDEPALDALLEDPANNDLLDIMAWDTQDFKATSETMTVSTFFEHLNTINKGGQNLRVFQILTKNDQILATEVLEEYARETVRVAEPAILTEATVDGIHEAGVSNSVTLIDRVRYENLVEGEEYMLEGRLVDKDTGETLLSNGEPITAESSFIASSADGETFQSFVFDGGALKDKSVVVFEKLIMGGFELAAHEDLNDSLQTVSFTLPPSGEPTPNPNDPNNPDNPNRPNDPNNPGTPGTPNEPGKPGEPGEPGNPNYPGTPGEPGEPPAQTGDSSNPELLWILLGCSFAVICGTVLATMLKSRYSD